MLSRLRQFFVGAPLDPLNPGSRKHIALITLMAWVGLGADALSSSCYGPEETFIALGPHPHLALYIAAFIVITIFIISAGYNQVIELFPSGGGGYKVATKLLHPLAGLVSGSALIVDYVLTVTVSIASGTDAIFSFLPGAWLPYKLFVEAMAIVLLLVLNMRGMKETIQILLPIFLGFIITHVALITYGIFSHASGLVTIIPETIQETKSLASTVGWLAVIGIMLHAYSLGSGTYTGLEAVSNNVQRLAEPRVQTGKRTTLLMAISLSFMAGGIVLLYLLWNAQPVAGRTLNAVVFSSMLGNSWMGQSLLILTLELEAGLLFIAANAGFVAGPSVLANMAVDGWLPNRFRHLSSRLVVQNGLLLMGVGALALLLITSGKVTLLVVLYSINVFITFSLSLLSVTIYWIKHRASSNWGWHVLLSAFACFVTTSILCVTLYYKFSSGGWMTLAITTTIVLLCCLIKLHYSWLAKKLSEFDHLLQVPTDEMSLMPHAINPKLPTAILFVNNVNVGMHTLLSVMRIFPGQFKNFVFLTAGAVDTASFSGQKELDDMQQEVNKNLDYFVRYCSQYQLPAEGYAAFGTDPILELQALADKVGAKYPHAVFFASALVFKNENIVTRYLHNHTPLLLQHYLHLNGKELMILPMCI
jgi:hypothetical protein